MTPSNPDEVPLPRCSKSSSQQDMVDTQQETLPGVDVEQASTSAQLTAPTLDPNIAIFPGPQSATSKDKPLEDAEVLLDAQWWSACNALKRHFLPSYQFDVTRDDRTRQHILFSEICQDAVSILTEQQRNDIPAFLSGDKWSGRGGDRSTMESEFHSIYKDAIKAFYSSAKEQHFPLTAVFETWTDLVIHSTPGHGNRNESGHIFRLEKHVYPFTLAVLRDPNFPIVREETELWVAWYGKKHAAMARFEIELIRGRKFTAIDSQVLLKALTILCIFLAVDAHLRKTEHSARTSTSTPTSLKDVFLKGLRKVTLFYSLHEHTNTVLERMQGFADKIDA